MGLLMWGQKQGFWGHKSPSGVQGQSPGGSLGQKMKIYFENNCQKHCLILGHSKHNNRSYQLYKY